MITKSGSKINIGVYDYKIIYPNIKYNTIV